TQRIDDCPSFLDRLSYFHQRFFQHRIAGSPGSDAQTLKDRNTRSDERPQCSCETSDCNLAQYDANDRHLQQHVVEVVLAAGIFADLLNPNYQANDADNKEPPEMADKFAEAHYDSGGQWKGYAKTYKQIRKDRDHPLQQCGNDQHRELPEEDGNLLHLDLAGPEGGQSEFFAFFANGARRDALPAKLRLQHLLVGRRAFTAHLFTRCIFSRKCKNWHGKPLLTTLYFC